MMKRVNKILIYIFIAFVITASGASILLFATSGTHTPAFLNSDGDLRSEAIAEERTISLGGTEQYVLLRGTNRSAPLLFYVHGGPGMTATPFLRTYNSNLEDQFLVVYWEQRGTNNSYNDRLAPNTMSISQITEDMSELIDMLMKEFNKEKVLIVAHSWGTIPALEYVAKSPDTVSAYISVAQTVNQIKSDTAGYEWALAKARKKQYKKSIKILEELGRPPYTYDEFVTQRKQVNFLGGSMLTTKSDMELAWIALQTPEFSWRNLGRVVDGIQLSGAALWEEQQQYNALTRHPRIEVPLFMLFGRYDHIISPEWGKIYFDNVDSPTKEFILFEKSAHAPMFEEPTVFNKTIINIAKKIGILEK